MGLNFYDTVGGRRFVDVTIPQLLKEIKKLNENISALTVAVKDLSEKTSDEERKESEK